MTTIGPASYFPTPQRTSSAERSTPNAGFADQAGQETAQPNAAQSSRLTELLAQAAALQKQQLSMSIKDYGLAKFGIEEQIAAERLKAGEQLDTYKLQFEGRIFNLAGKMYGPDVLKGASLSDSKFPMAKLATLDDNPLFSTPHDYVTSRRGVDISA